jgi:hypothetical protein
MVAIKDLRRDRQQVERGALPTSDAEGTIAPGQNGSPVDRRRMELVLLGAEGIPQRLKPNSLQGIYVRPEGRTLQKNEFFRSLFSPGNFKPVRNLPVEMNGFFSLRENFPVQIESRRDG